MGPTPSFAGRDGFYQFFHSLGIRLNGRPTWKLSDLLEASEAFIMGTACGVIGIAKVDGKPIGTGKPGAVTLMLLRGYRLAIERLIAAED